MLDISQFIDFSCYSFTDMCIFIKKKKKSKLANMLRTSKYHWTDKEKCAFLKKKNWDHFGLILDQNVFV